MIWSPTVDLANQLCSQLTACVPRTPGVCPVAAQPICHPFLRRKFFPFFCGVLIGKWIFFQFSKTDAISDIRSFIRCCFTDSCPRPVLTSQPPVGNHQPLAVTRYFLSVTHPLLSVTCSPKHCCTFHGVTRCAAPCCATTSQPLPIGCSKVQATLPHPSLWHSDCIQNVPHRGAPRVSGRATEESHRNRFVYSVHTPHDHATEWMPTGKQLLWPVVPPRSWFPSGPSQPCPDAEAREYNEHIGGMECVPRVGTLLSATHRYRNAPLVEALSPRSPPPCLCAIAPHAALHIEWPAAVPAASRAHGRGACG